MYTALNLCSNDVMTSLHGLNMWYRYKLFYPIPHIENCNSYIRRILDNEESNYLKYIILTEFNSEIPDNFLGLCKETEMIYIEMEDDLRIHINKRNIDLNESLMTLDLFHNILFDIISMVKGYCRVILVPD